MAPRAILVFTTIALLAIAGCSSSRSVPELNLQGDTPAIAATYVTTRTAATAHPESTHDRDAHVSEKLAWRYFRENNLVETEDLATQTGEVWQRDGQTQFFFKVFHADQKAVEYRMDDLKILEISASWAQHSLLLEPELLRQLKTVKAGWRDGYPYRELQGIVKDETLSVTWRVDINLPLKITRTHDGHTETSELQAVYPLEQSPWARRDRINYELIDYADLGDRERDPFVIRVQSLLPGGDVHHH